MMTEGHFSLLTVLFVYFCCKILAGILLIYCFKLKGWHRHFLLHTQRKCLLGLQLVVVPLTLTPVEMYNEISAIDGQREYYTILLNI